MRVLKLVLTAVCFSALAACGGGDSQSSASSAPVGPNVVTFTALDFAYDGPSEIPAGPTTFRMVASGKELHHLTLVKLEDGKTFDSLMAALAEMKEPGPMPSWMVFVGGPNAPMPGGESNATLNLEPGNYALLCFVDTPDKVPHIMKGMSRALTVTPAGSGIRAPLPPPTVTVTLSDYAFAPDQPFTLGKHTIKAVNVGVEPHEIVLLKMEEGKSMMDLAAWAESMDGPPPFEAMGGASPLNKSKEMQFDVDLVPGNYVMICFLPDSTGTKLHLEHGMVHTFELQ